MATEWPLNAEHAAVLSASCAEISPDAVKRRCPTRQCADEIMRSYRAAFLDLQTEAQEDIR